MQLNAGQNGWQIARRKPRNAPVAASQSQASLNTCPAHRGGDRRTDCPPHGSGDAANTCKQVEPLAVTEAERNALLGLTGTDARLGAMARLLDYLHLSDAAGLGSSGRIRMDALIGRMDAEQRQLFAGRFSPQLAAELVADPMTAARTRLVAARMLDAGATQWVCLKAQGATLKLARATFLALKKLARDTDAVLAAEAISLIGGLDRISAERMARALSA